tara:strand:+ start:2111 stop:3214 length:1104 start_codon:yes stop_codon:yes gene_type:complete
MAATTYILRTSDTIAESTFAATTRDFEAVIRDCALTTIDTAEEARDALASVNGLGGLRLRVGTQPQEYDTLTSTWGEGRLGFNAYQGKALLRRLEVQKDPDASGTTFRVKGTISSFGPPSGAECVPMRTTVESAGRASPSYRAAPIVPNLNSEAPASSGAFDIADWETTTGGLKNSSGTSGEEDYAPAGDIGGRYIDFNGQPIPQIVPQTRITIDLVRRLPYWQWKTPQQQGNDLQLYSQTINGDAFCPGNFWTPIGARNENGLLGFDRGYLRWESTTVTPLEDEFSTMRIVLLADAWKHATQIPRPTYFNDLGAMTTAGDPRAIKHYIGVYWSQPHVDSFDLGNWFYPAELDYLTKLSSNCGQTWP